jgi:hypothetical protein
MTTVHTQDLAIYSSKPTNRGENGIQMVRYTPTNNKSSYVGTQCIEFDIPGSSSQYVNLAKSELYMKLRFWKDKDKTEPFIFSEQTATHVDNEMTIPIDAIFHTIWRNIDISLNQTDISSCTNNYMYKAYLETLFSFSEACRNYQLHSVGYTGNDGNFDSTNPYKHSNIGALLRHKMLFKDNALNSSEGGLELLGNLMLDICNQKTAILNGVDIFLRFWPNKDEITLMTYPDTIKCYIEIANIYLDVCKIDVTPAITIGHDRALFKNNATYEFQKSEINIYNIPKGQYNFNKDNIFSNKTPSRVIVGFVRSEAYCGSQQYNPLKFGDYGIDTVTLYWEGLPVRKPYKIDLDNSLYLDTYMGMYRMLGKVGDDAEIPINRDQFKNGLTFFCFTVDPTSAPDLSYLGQRTTGNTSINVDFKTDRPTDFPLTVIVYATFPGTITIDEARVVQDVSNMRYMVNGSKMLKNYVSNKASNIDLSGTTAAAA